MEEIEKIMEEIRIRLKGYRVERTTVQDVPGTCHVNRKSEDWIRMRLSA